MDSDAFTKPFQLTKTMRRELYPAIEPTNPGLSAAGKIVVVTGAGGGVGSNVAKAWSQAGADAVVLVGHGAAKLEAVAAELERAVVFAADVTSESDVEKLFTYVQDKHGRLDVLVNAVGTMNHDKGIADISPSLWWQDYETNVKAAFLTTHFYAKQFGGTGTIINVVSLAAFLSAPNMSSYSTAKLAQIKFGELVGLEYPDLRVFSVHPGIVEAEGGRGMIVPMFTPFAKDKGILTGGVSLFLATSRADKLAGAFLSVNWDVDEVIENLEEIEGKGLLKPVGLRAQLSPDGYPWSK